MRYTESKKPSRLLTPERFEMVFMQNTPTKNQYLFVYQFSTIIPTSKGCTSGPLLERNNGVS
jgi:hypothetical protein